MKSSHKSDEFTNIKKKGGGVHKSGTYGRNKLLPNWLIYGVLCEVRAYVVIVSYLTQHESGIRKPISDRI